MGNRIPISDWAAYLISLGRRLASLPTVGFGEPAPRVAVSVPTGRFSYWLLAAGALSTQPTLDHGFTEGETVTTWIRHPFRIADFELMREQNEWVLTPTDKWQKDSLKAVRTPTDAPEKRRAARLSVEVADYFRKLENESGPWYASYAQHCLRPVVVIGRGREHINDQRRILLENVPHWFGDEQLRLLSRENHGTSEGNQMLFHPYMVLDERVGVQRPWVRSLTPRLTVVTSWASHTATVPSLFSRRPRVTIVNRRVRSSALFNDARPTLAVSPDLATIIERDRPSGIDVVAYTTPAEPLSTLEIGGGYDEEDDE